MSKIAGLNHAAHDFQGFPDTLIDFNDHKAGVGVLLFPPDQMGS